MLDLDARPDLRRLFLIARWRVSLGFVVAALVFWLARPTWASLTAGGLVAAVGEAVRVWASGHLVKSAEVTRSGPYRLTRHPLYGGSLVIGIGFVVAAADVVVAVVVLVYLAVMLFVAIRLEEATLRDAFGDEYDRYAAGRLAASDRRFSLARALGNGEHEALLGFVAALAILAFKTYLGATG